MKIWMSALAAVLAIALFALPAGGAATVHAADDVCGNEFVDVPDSGPTFDFTEACTGHDACYADGGSERDRRDCDEEFLGDMVDSCQEQPRWKRFACVSRAYTYYAGVRLGGWAFFPYGATG